MLINYWSKTMSTIYIVFTNEMAEVKRSNSALSIAAFMLGRKISDYNFIKKITDQPYAKVVDVMPCQGDVTKLQEILEKA
jgi:hypothetical protein